LPEPPVENEDDDGREWGDHAFAEFLETKAVLGYGESAT